MHCKARALRPLINWTLVFGAQKSQESVQPNHNHQVLHYPRSVVVICSYLALSAVPIPVGLSPTRDRNYYSITRERNISFLIICGMNALDCKCAKNSTVKKLQAKNKFLQGSSYKGTIYKKQKTISNSLYPSGKYQEI